MTVRQAVEKADSAAVEAAARPSVASVVRQAIETQSSAFQQVLPRTVDPDRFSRLVLTAIKSTPDLMLCFGSDQGRTSVLLAAMQAAAVGLEPNTPTQEAWLLPRRNKGVWECQLSIGYRGYLKLARRSPVTKSVVADVVYEKDHFVNERGLEEDRFEHKPAKGDRGKLVYAYAIVRYMTGGYHYVVLDQDDVYARRAKSDSWRSEKARPHSPWTNQEPAMWRKSAIRALEPFMDLSAEMAVAFQSDEKPLHFDDEAGVIEVASAFGELGPSEDEPPAEPDENGELPLEEKGE